MTAAEVKRLAHECGFELVGIAVAAPHSDARRYMDWSERGLAGAMGYLNGRRAGIRSDPANLLPGVQSIICVGKLYNSPRPHSTAFSDRELAWISRYAWGDDYHDVLRRGLSSLIAKMEAHAVFDYKICVDTAPLLERSYASSAGLGWIGRNTCLINQYAGSWFFLGELLVTLELQPDRPAEPRCGTCTRCIDACPTQALAPRGETGEFELDARLCISYFTIELKGSIPAGQRAGIGSHVFGCDICQDVCPWNRREALSLEPAFAPRQQIPLPLEVLAHLKEEEFRALFGDTPVARAKYRGFLRNVAVAMGNAKFARFRAPLEKLAAHVDPIVSEHARWALLELDS